ncbi:YjbH domain-containing protein [Pseudidiomarina donghaiensis]|nr:YjbH domain-containing protein [Pseudidiomarina donghaiensis]
MSHSVSVRQKAKKKALTLAIAAILLSPATYSVASAATSADTSTNTNSGVPQGPLAQSDFGGVGLMQTPTARMNPYGEMSINYADSDIYRRTAFSIQLFPWLETTARYTDIRNRLYSSDPNFSGDQTLKDKGFDAKLLLNYEGKYMPQFAVGLQDVGGTGIFAGEYIVANKRFSAGSAGGFDVSLGMGWGYLGRRDNISNPFCDIADRMCERGTQTTGRGGKFEVDKWFRGPAAVFGGVQYYVPMPEAWGGLSLMAEYDPNDYQQDRAGVPIEVDSPWNFGANYALNDNISFKVGYQRGNTVTFGFTLNYNFNSAHQLKLEPAKRQAQANQVAPATLNEVDYDRLANDLLVEAGWRVARRSTPGRDNVAVIADDIDQSSGIAPGLTLSKERRATVTLEATQTRFRDTAEAVDRAARILADALPEHITEYQIKEFNGNLGIKQHNINAEAYKTAYRGERFHTNEQNAIHTTSVNPKTAITANNNEFKNDFTWSIQPDLDQSFGGAEDFYIYQLSLKATGKYTLTNAWDVSGKLGINIADSYDKFNFLIDSQDTPLPRVRTRIREYAVNQNVWLDNLQVNYTKQLGNNLFASAYGGYLERMFGGVGGEVLYRPLHSDFAYGLDLNYVKQRDPYQDLGFDDYSVLTGHASLYYNADKLMNGAFGNSTVIARVGRFLAKDEGIQLEYQHEFDSGVIAGAFAAFTNVSDEDYGEGSFTKGFYLSIPFDLFFVRNTKTRGTIGWMPILRDGGQMLHRSRPLYNNVK